MLSYGLWQQRFAGDANVLGRRILLDGAPYVVIGVLRNFDYPQRTVELWTTMRFANADYQERNNNYLRVIAKLRPGVSVEQARSEMRIISDRLKRQYPKDNAHVGVTINGLRDEISDRSRLMLFALLGASFCVLLIACTNLANLLLARDLARRKEVAVRNALGAGRERLVRQMLTESLAIAILGGLLGVLIAAAAVPLLSRLVPNALPLAETPTIDSHILLFSLCLTAITGICFGVIPAVRVAAEASAPGLQEGSRQGVGGRKERLRSILVVAEVAISLILLVSSGLLLRALWRLQQVNPGFEAHNVLTMRMALPMPKYEPTARRTQFYTAVLSKIRELPGVSGAGYTSFLPIIHQGGIWPVTIAGQPKNIDRAFHQASLRFVTPGFLETMQIPLLRGRLVQESDTDKTQTVAVVSNSFVTQYWPNQDPIGRQFDFALDVRTIVGVVGDVRVRGIERISEPQVYLPYKQVQDGNLPWYAPKDLVVRYSGDSAKLLPAIRRIVAEADAEQPISSVQTLSEIVEAETTPRLIQLRVLGGFAFIAILLAGTGIHGLLSFTVTNRSQEIGVRIAVGAQRSDVLGMVLRESAFLALAGIVVGVVFAYAAGRTLQSLLAGVPPVDGPAYAAAVTLALCMILVGSVWPALRALRIDPIAAIRVE
ncbi:MAG: ABC transporter permease [Acidobacteriaceae bacterium]|nr:ABC transporter permease [Acidobacteriaceae bacterium]